MKILLKLAEHPGTPVAVRGCSLADLYFRPDLHNQHGFFFVYTRTADLASLHLSLTKNPSSTTRRSLQLAATNHVTVWGSLLLLACHSQPSSTWVSKQSPMTLPLGVHNIHTAWCLPISHSMPPFSREVSPNISLWFCPLPSICYRLLTLSGYFLAVSASCYQLSVFLQNSNSPNLLPLLTRQNHKIHHNAGHSPCQRTPATRRLRDPNPDPSRQPSRPFHRELGKPSLLSISARAISNSSSLSHLALSRTDGKRRSTCESHCGIYGRLVFVVPARHFRQSLLHLHFFHRKLP